MDGLIATLGELQAALAVVPSAAASGDIDAAATAMEAAAAVADVAVEQISIQDMVGDRYLDPGELIDVETELTDRGLRAKRCVRVDAWVE